MTVGAKSDVVIIGGGVIGLCTAYYAAAKGAVVTVVEKNRLPAGSSAGNAGLLVPSHCQPLATPGIVAEGIRHLLNPEGSFSIRLRPEPALFSWLWRFYRSCTEARMLRGMEIYSRLGKESIHLHQVLAGIGGDAYRFSQNGMISVFANRKDFEMACRDAQRLEGFGLASEILTGTQVHDLDPAIAPDMAGAVMHPADGRIDPAAFILWLAKTLRDSGVRILEDTETYGFQVTSGHIARVQTTRGDLSCEQLVVAAGAWCPRVIGPLGVKVPVQAGKGFSLTFTPPENGPTRPLLLPEVALAVTPYADKLRLAGILEFSGLDDAVSPRRLEAMKRDFKRYVPNLGAMQQIEIWRGFRPCAPDGLPVIGRAQALNNLFVATGHAMKGISLGPVTGRLMADMLDGGSIGDLQPALSPDRF
jgi:D-amino-acid dehydrogenase